MLTTARDFTLRLVARAKIAFADREGATAIEYGLLAALISVVIIGAVTTVGSNLTTTFTTVANKLT